MVVIDPHPVAKYRVIGPLSNMPEFHRAFGCKRGDAMVREDDKQLEQQLNQAIASHKDEFKTILTSCGVKHFAPALGTGGL